MFVWKSEEARKEFHEECIICEEGWVKHYKKAVEDCRKSIKQWKEIVKTSPSEFNKSWLKGEKRLLKLHMGALKNRRELLVKWQEKYEHYYGPQFSHGKARPMKRSAKQNLTVIQGGLTDTKIHGGILSDTGKAFIEEFHKGPSQPEKV